MSIDIFLSYAREDSATASELARVLEADGCSVWWERTNSRASDGEIDSVEALSTAKAVVVLWSTFSVSSSRVKDEAREAKASNRLIPILIEDARVPLSFRSLNPIDFREWPNQPAPHEMMKFKSMVSRTLDSGIPGQKVRNLATSDGMSLSVRVASHMATARSGSDADAKHTDFSQAIERCITDIFLDILKTLPDTVDSKIDSYIQQLANTLRTPVVIRSNVDFSLMSIKNIRSINPGKVTAMQEKAILEYVNQYCSPSGEYNLRLEAGKWPDGKVLCLPLAQFVGGREFAWFIADAVNGEWTPSTQEQMLRLASGIQAGSRLAP